VNLIDSAASAKRTFDRAVAGMPLRTPQSDPSLATLDLLAAHRPIPRRAWVLHLGTLGASVAAVVAHGRLVLENTVRGVAPLFVWCLVALFAASAISTRFGGVKRGTAAGWNLTTAAISCCVLTAVLAVNTPSMRAHIDLPTAMYLGFVTLAMFAPLATAQVIVGWLVARPDTASDSPMHEDFAHPNEPAWRTGIAAALAAIEHRRSRSLDASEQQMIGELALGLQHDSAAPTEIAGLGPGLCKQLVGNANRRQIAALLSAALAAEFVAVDPYRR
jgi:hypothetical protein